MVEIKDVQRMLDAGDALLARKALGNLRPLRPFEDVNHSATRRRV